LLAVLAAVLLLAGPAHAQDGTAPPGLSGVDEYLETVPGGDGDRGTGSRPQLGEDDDGGGSVPSGTVRRLKQAGPDGQDAAALAVEATRAQAPKSASGAGGTKPGGAVAAPAPAVDLGVEPGDGPLASIGQLLSGSSEAGAGVAFPLVLLLVLAGGLVMAFVRRSRSA
jgi:hypothetical protein